MENSIARRIKVLNDIRDAVLKHDYDAVQTAINAAYADGATQEQVTDAVQYAQTKIPVSQPMFDTRKVNLNPPV